MLIKKQAKKEAKTLPLANLPTEVSLTDKELSEVNGGGGNYWGGEDFVWMSDSNGVSHYYSLETRLWGG